MNALAEARSAYDVRAWVQACEHYAAAEQETRLDAEDLERFAVAAMVAGRMSDYFAIRERAYAQLLAEGDLVGAAMHALWSGMQHLVSGEVVEGGGWLARAARLVEEDGTDSVPAAYLKLSDGFGLMATGDLDQAVSVTRDAVAEGRRLGCADLVGLALHQEGLLLLEAGRTAEGLARLDESMVELGSGSLSPMITGIVYCGAILGCWSVYELLRAEQWTAAMARWCDAQPELGNFNGECKIHRAELHQLRGGWDDARAQLDRVSVTGPDAWAVARAAYVRGNLDRLQGRFDAAEEQYAEAGRLGCDPQPGLALLRFARGGEQAAAAMIRRCLAERQENARRVEVLVAAVEILLATDELDRASAAAEELGALATRCRTAMVEAFAAQARARLGLARDEPESTLAEGRAALRRWVELRSPYEEARTRTLIAEACRRLGDAESADRETEAARSAFAALGIREATDGVLSPRELEVLRLVATGATNRAIAGELVLSERTVDRHVSNILAKLGVSTRAAATAYALQRRLI